MKICCTLVILVCFPAVSCAQLPFLKKNKDSKAHEPDAVFDTLRSGSAVQRSQLATELGIMTPNFSSPTAKSNAPCVNFDHVDERRVRLRTDAENVVIVASSGECDSTYIIVFDKAQKSEWHHLAVRLAARAQPPEISFAELIQPGVSEIVVHREITRDSGSAQQENFVVLKLLHDWLVPVLDTAERVELTMPDQPENDADNVEQSQQSTFRLMKADPNSGASTRILEKEVLKQRKTNLTRYRLWSWDPELERFRSSPHDGSEIAQPPPPKNAATPSAGGAAVQPKQK